MSDKPTISEYKGNSLLVLNPESRYPFQFGLTKAKMILEHLDSIKAFVDSEGKSVTKKPTRKPRTTKRTTTKKR